MQSFVEKVVTPEVNGLRNPLSSRKFASFKKLMKTFEEAEV